ncbi:glutaredoxin 3 [Thiobacillus sp.]
MARVVMYCTAICPYCVAAEQLLKSRGATEIDKIRIDLDPAKQEEMLTRSGGRRTVPQVFIGDTHVGGFDDTSALDAAGKLVPLLNRP